MSSANASLADALHALIAGSVATHEAVADRLGINPTDLRCLGLATSEPGLTPTRLAELAGLTTGAITGVLDRLERAGFVRREADPADRRRLRVQLVPDRLGELTAYYKPLIGRAVELSADLEPAARAQLAGYLETFATTLHDEAARLRVAARGGMVGATYTAPLGSLDHARLVYGSGAPRLAFGGSALGQQVRVVAETAASRLRFGGGGVASSDELIRATFAGPPPDVKIVDGVVTMRYSRRLLDARSRLADVALNPAVPWSIEVDGGVTDLDGDLRAVRLSGLDIRGGANHVRLRLGAPDGTARVTLDSGASAIRFDRPRGVAAALQVRGGVSRLRFDGRVVKTSGGNFRVQTKGFAVAPDRYEFELSGGASDLTIGEA
jgi:DNA-binding MarR family transcriptional regulator